MSKVIVLKEWSVSVCPGNDPYKAPEAQRKGLAGKAYGHPNFPDGAPVFTSAVDRAEGRRVWTKSGSEYVLEGPPDAGYVKYLVETKHAPLDLENPLGKIGVM
jgi:hypothetical protein